MPDSERKLPDWIDSYLQYSENSEPPKIFHKWCAISVIAAALRRKCWLEWGPTMFYPNMYVVLTAPPGKARKGTAMKYAQRFFEYLEVPLIAESTTRECLIRALAESLQKEDYGLTPIEHSSVVILSPELTVFLGYNNMQLMSDLTDWFDCANRWTYRTKNMGTDVITGVFVNMLGATTPDLLRSTLPSDAVGGGLTSRMVFVFAEKKGKIVPFPFQSKESKDLINPLYNDIGKINLLRGNFHVTEDFLDVWMRWYTAQEHIHPFGNSQVRALDGYIERRPTHVLKLSMIMSASRTSSMKITGSDLKRAIETLEEAELDMPAALGGVGKSELADLTYRVYYAIRAQPMTRRELANLFMYDGSKSVLDEVLNTLMTSGKIDIAIVEGHNTFICTEDRSKFNPTEERKENEPES